MEKKEKEVCRCPWCCDGGIMQEYHDKEWGVPLHDDRKQFEFLMMEVMQCGLNWYMMLKKREVFKKCFENFNYKKIAKYSEEDIQRILETPGMIRSRRKVEAVINNAQKFIQIQKENESFSKWIWSFTNNKVMHYKGHDKDVFVASNELSDAISKELKAYGFKYLGSITVYSHLQACGIINDHLRKCFRFKQCEE